MTPNSSAKLEPAGMLSRDILPQGKWRFVFGALAVAGMIAVVSLAIMRGSGAGTSVVYGQLTEDRLIVLREEIARLSAEMANVAAEERAAGLGAASAQLEVPPAADEISPDALNPLRFAGMPVQTGEGATESWRDGFRLVQRLYVQRLDLIKQCESAQVRLAQTQAALAVVNDDINIIGVKRAVSIRRGISLERSSDEIRQAITFVRNARVRAEYDAMLNQANESYATCQAHCAWLKEQESALIPLYMKLWRQLGSIELTVAELGSRSEKVRVDWLAASDAYGQLARGDYPFAVTVFSDWIVAEADNPLPYLARGLAHYNTGNNELAVADFGHAARLDPIRSDRMIREIREADGRN